MVRSLCYIVLIMMPFIACKTTPKIVEVKKGFDFVDSESLTEIIDQARAENKLIFVDFYTDWCLPCKLMDSDVFTDKNVIDFFKEHFVSYKVDSEKGGGPNLSFLYSVKSYPTLLFLDINGRILQRKEGAAYQTELMKLARTALELNDVNAAN